MRLGTWMLVIPGALASAGCGAWLSVNGASDLSRHPGGIAVNQRAIYAVKAKQGATDLKTQPIVTVDPTRVTVVNWTRMPFSSGELTIKLTKEQTLKELSVDGTSGGAQAVEAASAVVNALGEIERAREE